ncbi:MAG: ABC transporter substrate-binding protein [Candidatus Tectomicrobia bacterium]|nr:ABC transporter substrate-binding protein [Candidatus Tectomicrobia bacterium]
MQGSIKGFWSRAFIFSLALLMVMGGLSAALAADDKPVYGGIMKIAIAGDPPSLDMHQETTFKVKIPMSNCYNTLISFDPHNFPEIIGDLAESWETSEDGKTWTFKVRQGVKFHDGTELTSADVKASWDRIVWPKGTISTKKSYYNDMMKSIETPDPYTVVYHLNYPSAAFLPMLAYPHNFIFSKARLDKDPNWYKQNVMGTGPFKLKKYVRGSYLEVERNPNYFKEGLPYLDGIKYYMIKDLSARGKSVRTARTHAELRGFPPAEAEAIKADMGDKVVVRYPKAIVHWGVAFNANHKPFNDERVRQAMSLALDRYDMAKVLGPLTGLESVGGLMHPDTKWSLTPEELQGLPGFGKDHEANIQEAKRLLKEAGYPNGFQTVLTNRSVKLPYIDYGVYLVSAWKKIRVEAEHKLEESATWSKNRRTGNFAVLADPYGSAGDGDPDQVMNRFTTGASGNYGKFSDPEVDKLYKAQKTELDEKKRIEMVKQMQKIIIGKGHFLPGLWWTRIEVRSALIKNYEPHHNHHMNRRFEDAWLAKQ